MRVASWLMFLLALILVFSFACDDDDDDAADDDADDDDDDDDDDDGDDTVTDDDDNDDTASLDNQPLLELIDGGGSFSNPTSIAVAPNGDRYVLTLRSHCAVLFVEDHVTGTVTSEQVGVETFDADLALGEDGRVFVAYRDFRVDRLIVATRESGTWSREIVDHQPGSGSDVAIVAAQGVVHLAYRNQVAQSIRYGRLTPSGWVVETVDHDPGTGINDVALAIDNAGHAHVAYYDNDSGLLRYATNALGVWSVATPAPARVQDSGVYVAATVDSDGVVDLFDSGPNVVRQTGNRGGDWQTTVLRADDPSSDTDVINVVIDAAGVSHVVNHVSRRGMFNLFEAVEYRTNAGGTWRSANLSLAADHNAPADVTLDHAGAVHVSLALEGGLAVVKKAGGDWIPTSLAPPRFAGGSAMLADPSGNLHLAYLTGTADSETTRLVVAHQTGDGWQREAVAPDARHVVAPRLAQASDGSLFVAAIGPEPDYPLWVYTNESGAWQQEWLADTYSFQAGMDIAISPDDTVHVVFQSDEPTHATRADGEWSLESLADVISAINGPSLAIDSSGHLHVAATPSLEDRLMYLTDKGGSWSSTTVLPDYGAAYRPSLALGPDDQIYIAFFDVTASRASLASKNGASWVESGLGDMNYHSSVAMTVDQFNRPQIACGSWDEHISLQWTDAAGSYWSETIAEAYAYWGGAPGQPALTPAGTHFTYSSAGGLWLARVEVPAP